MRYRILTIIVGLLVSLPGLATSSEENSLAQKFYTVKQIIDNEGYTEPVCSFFNSIRNPENFDHLEPDQLLLLSEFLRDNSHYEEAALGFIMAFNKGLKDRHAITYLEAIGDENKVDLIALIKKSSGNQFSKEKTIEVLTAYWKESEEFLKSLQPVHEAQDIARYFISKSADNPLENDLTNMKLQKLCSYAQGHYLALHERPLFTNDIEAWTHGPVIREIYHEYKKYKTNPIPPAPIKEDLYQADIKKFLDDIYMQYGKYAAWTLSSMTHQDSYWCNTPRDAVIPHHLMLSHFKELIVKTENEDKKPS
jgi:uncharacterized phage-associated protein